ncbi:PucR family transcriptional regulator [Nocardiopsis sp. NPDC050513]|uniref:PucR family transcriptional regulator n=1 Tax=Nocardiopsis sp. NPDC050513 TaxID=3364338 RepID=UPI0037906B90
MRQRPEIPPLPAPPVEGRTHWPPPLDPWLALASRPPGRLRPPGDGAAQASLAMCWEGWSAARVSAAENVIRDRLGAVSLVALSFHGAHVVLPTASEDQAARGATAVRTALGGRSVWIGVGWSPQADVRHGRRMAHDVLALVCGLRLPPGVYRLGDIPMEYASAQIPAVREMMSTVAARVIGEPHLHGTLEALVDARGNRSRAAKALFIHRSTIDYRLERIRTLTGHDPTQPQGLQFLRTAMALQRLRRPPAPLV